MRHLPSFLIGSIIAAAFCQTASADPIMGTMVMTVAPYYGTLKTFGGTYASGTIDLSNPPPGGLGLQSTGFQLGPGGLVNSGENVNTTFDLRVTFNGASGSQPYVDVTGTLTGGFGGDGLTYNMSGWFTVTPTSATLMNWSPASGIPVSLIDQYLNLSNYHILGSIGGNFANNIPYFYGTIGTAAPAAVPEPTTGMMYLLGIAGLGMWHLKRRIGVPIGSERPQAIQP